MTKVRIQKSLRNISLILIVTVIFQTEYGYTSTLSDDMIEKINKCAVEGNTNPIQNQDRLMDTKEILKNINYPPGFKMYHPLLNRVLDMTADRRQPVNKCFLYFCLSQLQQVGFDKSIANENKKAEIYGSIQSGVRLSSKLFDFTLSYYNDLTHCTGVPMNPSTYCLYKMCLGDLDYGDYDVTGGIKNGYLYKKQELVDNLSETEDEVSMGAKEKTPVNFQYYAFFRKFLEDDYGQLIGRYTKEYMSESKLNLNAAFNFCTRIMCEEELKHVGFNFNSDGRSALRYFGSEKHFMSIYDIYSFVNHYGSYLNNKIEKNSLIIEEHRINERLKRLTSISLEKKTPEKFQYYVIYRRFLEVDYGHLVRKYTMEYMSDENEENQTNAYNFCARIKELKYVGFNFNSDGRSALRYFGSEKHFMTIYDIYSFVNHYGSYLNKKIEKKSQRSYSFFAKDDVDTFKRASVKTSTTVEPARYCVIAT